MEDYTRQAHKSEIKFWQEQIDKPHPDMPPEFLELYRHRVANHVVALLTDVAEVILMPAPPVQTLETIAA